MHLPLLYLFLEILTFEKLVESLRVSSVICVRDSLARAHALRKNLVILFRHALEQVAEQEGGSTVVSREVSIHVNGGVVEHSVSVVCYHGLIGGFLSVQSGRILGLGMKILEVMLVLGAVDRVSVVY